MEKPKSHQKNKSDNAFVNTGSLAVQIKNNR